MIIISPFFLGSAFIVTFLFFETPQFWQSWDFFLEYDI